MRKFNVNIDNHKASEKITKYIFLVSYNFNFSDIKDTLNELKIS